MNNPMRKIPNGIQLKAKDLKLQTALQGPYISSLEVEIIQIS